MTKRLTQINIDALSYYEFEFLEKQINQTDLLRLYDVVVTDLKQDELGNIYAPLFSFSSQREEVWGVEEEIGGYNVVGYRLFISAEDLEEGGKERELINESNRLVMQDTVA